MSATLVCQDCRQCFEAKRSDAKRCSGCHKVHRKQYQHEYEHGRRRGTCADCGADICARAMRCLPCDNKWRVKAYEGQNNPNWREGKTAADGYIYVRTRAGTPGKGKGAFYRGEHIVVWEKAHGKPLPKGWVVHHLNGIRDDNRPENLVGMPRKEHSGRLVVAPYQARILELERLLAEKP